MGAVGCGRMESSVVECSRVYYGAVGCGRVESSEVECSRV